MSAHSQNHPRLKDVALKAGVSSATVSYVLNHHQSAERIGSETKRRIWAAAEQLGYKFNPIGRALQRGYSNEIALIAVSWNLAISHAATAMAISRQAARFGLALNIQVVDDDANAEAFVRRNSLHNLAGVVALWDSMAFRESWLSHLAADGVPVIDLLPGTAESISVVTADREAAAFRATSHLAGLGHRHIGLISDSVTRPKTSASKLAGYRRALQNACLTFQPTLVQEVTEFGFEGGQFGLRWLIRRCPEMTALFCINDAIALGAIDAARELGRECPRDLSVVGFGDSPEASHWRPALTTVALSAERVAEKTIEVILAQRRGRPLRPKRISIPEELVIRGSTGPLRSPAAA